MYCLFCNKDFHAFRRDAKFCGAKCRAGAYRLRLRLAARSGGSLAAEQETDDPRQNRHAELLTAASGSANHPRVPLERQILSQLPPAACRYRLVLGVSSLLAVPVMVPEGDGWNVLPFEPPSDPRLLPGHHYRIIWFDQHGQEVPPLDLEPAPNLYFFLGKPNAERTSQGSEDRGQTRTIVELRHQVRKLEAELAAARESCQQSEEKRKKSRRQMRRRLRKLKAAHRAGSLRGALEKWGPLLAASIGGYAVRSYRGSTSDAEKGRPAANEPAGQTAPRAEFDVLRQSLPLLALLVAESFAKTNPALSTQIKTLIAVATGAPRAQAAPKAPSSAAPAPPPDSDVAQEEHDVAEVPPADAQSAEQPPEVRDELLPEVAYLVLEGPGRWQFQRVETSGGGTERAAQAEPMTGPQGVVADEATPPGPEQTQTVKPFAVPTDTNEEREDGPPEGVSEGSTNAPLSRNQAGQLKAPSAARRPRGSQRRRVRSGSGKGK